MISAEDAHSVILSSQAPKELFTSVEVGLEDLNGHFLADDIYASRNQPPFNRAMMDGIAISTISSASKRNKEGIARAGFPKLSLKNSDCCIEVMTGASVPDGCDCVIPYEEVQDFGEYFEIKDPKYKIETSKFIHAKSSDYKMGDLLLKKGIVINSTIISLLCSLGHTKVKVLQLNSVAIISTGDELVEPGKTVERHQIYKSNPYAIRSEILHFFPNSKIDLFHLNDDENEIENGLSKILSSHKLIIISGGVSKGKFDFIPSTLKKLGAKESFHKVRQRPGKPLWFGLGQKGQIIFGLPGNPVSSLVNTRRHIIPLLENFRDQNHRSHYSVEAVEDMDLNSDFTHYIPVVLSVVDGRLCASPSTGNNSGDFSRLVFSKGFIEVPMNERKIIKNKIYEFYPWGSLGQSI